jgi:hypothetical protein
MFVTGKLLKPSLMFAGKARPYPSELPLPCHYYYGLKLHITIVNYDRKTFIVQETSLTAL